MIRPRQTVSGKHLYQVIGVLALLCMISACGTRGGGQNPGPGERAHDGVAILGVTTKKGLKTVVNQNMIASELTARLAERGDVLLVPESQVSSIVGKDVLNKMLGSVSKDGRLRPFEIERLRAADLRARRAIVLRLESDEKKKLPVFKEAVYNEAGIRVVDRERKVYVVRRTTELSASVLDLQSGAVVWTRRYRISPESKSLSSQYLGSSFSGSVAAEVANTVINGFGDNRYPPAPSLQGNLRALIREIAFNMPKP